MFRTRDSSRPSMRCGPLRRTLTIAVDGPANGPFSALPCRPNRSQRRSAYHPFAAASRASAEQLKSTLSGHLRPSAAGRKRAVAQARYTRICPKTPPRAWTLVNPCPSRSEARSSLRNRRASGECRFNEAWLCLLRLQFVPSTGPNRCVGRSIRWLRCECPAMSRGK